MPNFPNVLAVFFAAGVVCSTLACGRSASPVETTSSKPASAAHPSTLVASASMVAAAAKPMALHVLTWNIQYGSNGGADGNQWPQRKPLLFTALKAEAPDIFCAQEVLPDQLSDLKKEFPEFGIVAAGRDGPGQGEHAPVFYRADRFVCLDKGTFWYNEDTTRPGKDWDPEYNRICTWVELREKSSGVKFRVWNTHFPLGAAARAKAAALLSRTIKKNSGLPAVVTGDFNEPLGPNQWPEIRQAGLIDSFSRAEKKEGLATFRWKGMGISRIDWVLASREWQIQELHTVDKEANAIHASDHNAVACRLMLPAEATNGPDHP